MADKIYINQPVSIEIEISIDGDLMATATSAAINARKPDKTEVTWPADFDNVSGKITYAATAEDIDQSGRWLLQPLVTVPPGNALPGSVVEMEIAKRFT